MPIVRCSGLPTIKIHGTVPGSSMSLVGMVVGGVYSTIFAGIPDVPCLIKVRTMSCGETDRYPLLSCRTIV